jgi:hypothetical protein
VLRLLTWDRMGPLGKNGGSSVGKDGECDVESRHLQDSSPHLCRLRTEGLVPMNKYLTYWSHAGDMGPVNRCSWSATNAQLYPYCFNGFEEERNWVWTHRSVSQHVMDWDRSPFLGRSSSVQRCWRLRERLPGTGTARRKCMSDIRGLAQKAYMSFVSGFPCRVYIDLNHHNSRIWVIACLVAVIK